MENDYVCPTCGINLFTGKPIAEEAQRQVGTGTPNTLSWLAGVGLAALVVVILIGVMIYAANSDPLAKARQEIEELNFVEAQDILRALVEREPEHEEARFEYGKLFFRADQFRAASEQFEKAHSINQGNADYALWAAVSIYMDQGIQSIGKQSRLLENAVQFNSDNELVWYLLAMSRAAKDPSDYEGQIAALKQVAALSDENDASNWGMGLGYGLQGRYFEATRALEAVSGSQRASDMNGVLGMIALQQGDQTKGLNELRNAIDNHEGGNIRGHVLTKLAQLYLQNRQYRDAERHLTQALELNRNNMEIQYLLGLSLHAQGLANQAIGKYERVMNDKGPYAADSAVQLASLYLGLGDFGKAESALRVASGLQVSSPAYYTMNGRILASVQDEQGAFRELNKAIQVDARYAPAFLERGLLYVQANKIPRGIGDLEQYLKLLGSDTRGTRAADIRALVNQLRRTIGS
jgi:tetratricopeptide (TPR) repeat protein